MDDGREPKRLTLHGVDSAEFFAEDGVAVFVSDPKQRIIAWNAGAERAFGYSAEDVLGKPCYGKLKMVDRFHQIFCRRNCPVRQAACRKKSVAPIELVMRHAAGGVMVASFAFLMHFRSEDDPSNVDVMHLLWPLVDGAFPADEADELSGRSEAVSLSPREIEILGLLGKGWSTREIALALDISAHTVRTHAQHILGKLQVSSRMKAVALARRHDWI